MEKVPRFPRPHVSDFFVQDATAGINVEGSISPKYPHLLSQFVEVEGVTGPGKFARFSLPALVPGPRVPNPFINFRQEHFCRIWRVFVAAETGEESRLVGMHNLISAVAFVDSVLHRGIRGGGFPRQICESRPQREVAD